MNKKIVCFGVILVLLMGISACTAQTGTQISAISSPTALIIDTITPAPIGCRPEQTMLDELEAQLPYNQRVIYYQAYAGEQSLVVWFVDSELGTEYIAENEIKALEKAVEVAGILAPASVCGQSFDLLHITVVGVDYTQWFSGSIRPSDIPLAESMDGGVPDEERGAGITVETEAPPPLPGTEFCDWQMVTNSLDAEFKGSGSEMKFYYVRDSDENTVFIHWVLSESDGASESLPLLARVVKHIGCLYPQPTGISLTAAGQDGVMVFNGYLPGTKSGDAIVFNLDDFSYQSLGSD